MPPKSLIRVVVYLLVYLGVPVVAVSLNNETLGAVLGIVYISLLIPFGILKLIDFYRTNAGSTLFSSIFNALFRVPVALFGLVCLVAGVAIIGWVLYNVFVERQKEYSGPRFIVGFGSFGAAVPLVLYGWLTLRSVLRRRNSAALSPEQQQEFEREEDDEEQVAEAMRRRHVKSEEK
jgi:hypothetical protein